MQRSMYIIYTLKHNVILIGNLMEFGMASEITRIDKPLTEGAF